MSNEKAAPIPEDLREMYLNFRNPYRCGNDNLTLCLLIERIATLTAEVAALKAEIDLRVEQGKALNEDKERFKAENARLKAPVSELAEKSGPSTCICEWVLNHQIPNPRCPYHAPSPQS